MTSIIILQGVSSSGKSIIAKELQKRVSEKYTLVGFDYAVETLDKEYWPGGSREKEGFYYIDVVTDQGSYPELRHGPIGAAFLEKMLQDIIQLAKSGENIIIDSILSNEEYTTLVNECVECHILHVGVRAPLPELIRREKERGDRKFGIAEAAYEEFYQNKKFDLIVDTVELTATEAVERILHAVQLLSIKKPNIS